MAGRKGTAKKAGDKRRAPRDVQQEVTDRIIARLEAGTAPWKQGWVSAGMLPMNINTRRPYRGVNLLLLGIMGYSSPWWATLKQVHDRGGRVLDGEIKKYTEVVIFKQRPPKDKESEDPKDRKPRLYRSYYRVYNLEQTEGVTPPELNWPLAEFTPVEACEQLIAGMPNPPTIIHGRGEPAYSPGSDEVDLPSREAFVSEEEYYSGAFHELTHSTGHVSRLDRDGEWGHRGTAAYSKEELIAAMGEAMLCAFGGIEPAVVDNIAAYCHSWAQTLGGDKSLVMAAASQAQAAVDYITGYAPPESAEPVEEKSEASVAK